MTCSLWWLQEPRRYSQSLSEKFTLSVVPTKAALLFVSQWELEMSVGKHSKNWRCFSSNSQIRALEYINSQPWNFYFISSFYSAKDLENTTSDLDASVSWQLCQESLVKQTKSSQFFRRNINTVLHIWVLLFVYCCLVLLVVVLFLFFALVIFQRKENFTSVPMASLTAVSSPKDTKG